MDRRFAPFWLELTAKGSREHVNESSVKTRIDNDLPTLGAVFFPTKQPETLLELSDFSRYIMGAFDVMIRVPTTRVDPV